jgi:hypothetical protein
MIGAPGESPAQAVAGSSWANQPQRGSRAHRSVILPDRTLLKEPADPLDAAQRTDLLLPRRGHPALV